MQHMGGLAQLVPAGNVRLTPRSAVGGESAGGGVGVKMTWKMLLDLEDDLEDDSEEKGLFGAFPVFRNSSPLWVALALETQKPKTVTGSGQLSGEPVF